MARCLSLNFDTFFFIWVTRYFHSTVRHLLIFSDRLERSLCVLMFWLFIVLPHLYNLYHPIFQKLIIFFCICLGSSTCQNAWSRSQQVSRKIRTSWPVGWSNQYEAHCFDCRLRKHLTSHWSSHHLVLCECLNLFMSVYFNHLFTNNIFTRKGELGFRAYITCLQ